MFANIKRISKAKFFNKDKSNLTNLSKRSPRQFWKKINKFKKNNHSTVSSPSMDEFFTHFKNISNSPHDNANFNDFSNNGENGNNNTTDSINENNGHENTDSQNINVEYLDNDFTESEILKVLTLLKRNKSPGDDKVVADFFH